MIDEFLDALNELLEAVHSIIVTLHLPEQHEQALHKAYAHMAGAVMREAMVMSKELLEIQDAIQKFEPETPASSESDEPGEPFTDIEPPLTDTEPPFTEVEL